MFASGSDHASDGSGGQDPAYRRRAASAAVRVAGLWAEGYTVDLADNGTDRLHMALDALIENAVKQTNPGGEIRLTARREGDQVAIAVAEAHGGSVRVWSALVRGSVFEILLPLPRTPAGAVGK